MREATYIINATPVALARCRFGQGRAWDSQKHIKRIWSVSLEGQHEGPFFEPPIEMEVHFYFPIPPSYSKKKKSTAHYHFIAPDLSNCIKFIEDCGHDILYRNDCIISRIIATKQYTAEESRTVLTIRQL